MIYWSPGSNSCVLCACWSSAHAFVRVCADSAFWYNGNIFSRRVLPTSTKSGGTLPRSVFETLSPAGKRVARHLVCEGEEVAVDWQPDWDVTKRVGGGGGANAAHKGEAVAQLRALCVCVCV